VACNKEHKKIVSQRHSCSSRDVVLNGHRCRKIFNCPILLTYIHIDSFKSHVNNYNILMRRYKLNSRYHSTTVSYFSTLTMNYTIDRSFHLSIVAKLLFGVIILLCAAVITIINFAAVGYDNVATVSANFNGSNPLWYDIFIPVSGRSRHRNCSAASFNLEDCTTPYFPY